MKTSTIVSTILTTIITLLSLPAFAADSVTVACYSSSGDAQLHLQFWAAPTIGLVYSYAGAHGEDSCIAEPKGSFGKKASYVKITGSTTTALEMVAQIITGDMIEPIFECNAEVKLSVNSDGQMIFQSGTVHHLNVQNDLAEFVGQSCYVQ